MVEDAATRVIVSRIAEAFDLDVRQFEATRSGQRRSVFAETSNDGQVVIKWSHDAEWGNHLSTVIPYVEALSHRGYPAPRTHRHGPIEGLGYAWVQERLPGSPTNEGPDEHLLGQVLDAIDLQVNANKDIEIPDMGDWSWVPAVVFDDEAGWWRAARSLGDDIGRLCNELDAWVRAVPRVEIRTDWVHLDCNFSNILSENGRLTGIVDLDHLAIGDRSVDITCLAFSYERLRLENDRKPMTDAVARLKERVLGISGESGWRQAVAYNVIARLGWTNANGFRTPVETAFASARSVIDPA